MFTEIHIKNVDIASQINNDSILGNKWKQYKHFTNYCKKNKPVPDYIPKTYLIKKSYLDKPIFKKIVIINYSKITKNGL